MERLVTTRSCGRSGQPLRALGSGVSSPSDGLPCGKGTEGSASPPAFTTTLSPAPAPPVGDLALMTSTYQLDGSISAVSEAGVNSGEGRSVGAKRKESFSASTTPLPPTVDRKVTTATFSAPSPRDRWETRRGRATPAATAPSRRAGRTCPRRAASSERGEPGACWGRRARRGTVHPSAPHQRPDSG